MIIVLQKIIDYFNVVANDVVMARAVAGHSTKIENFNKLNVTISNLRHFISKLIETIQCIHVCIP